MLSKGGVVPTSVARIRGVRPVSPAARPLTIILELGGEVTLSMPAAGLPRLLARWLVLDEGSEVGEAPQMGALPADDTLYYMYQAT